jgi:hypothetical protein
VYVIIEGESGEFLTRLRHKEALHHQVPRAKTNLTPCITHCPRLIGADRAITIEIITHKNYDPEIK